MATRIPDLTGNITEGIRQGVPGGPIKATTQTKPSLLQPGTVLGNTSPVTALQTRWRPESLADFHTQLDIAPEQASRTLDRAVQQAYQNTTTLETMIASRQSGSAAVTGSITGIPTGLSVVNQVQGSIDNGSVAHNFYCSVVKSSLPGCVDIFVWQPTANNNVTPIPCTTTVTVRWVADGTI